MVDKTLAVYFMTQSKSNNKDKQEFPYLVKSSYRSICLGWYISG